MIESGHLEAMDAACVPLLATSFPCNYLKSITECKKKKSQFDDEATTNFS